MLLVLSKVYSHFKIIRLERKDGRIIEKRKNEISSQFVVCGLQC